MSKKIETVKDSTKHRNYLKHSTTNVKESLRKNYQKRMIEFRHSILDKIRNLNKGLHNLQLVRDSLKIEASGLTSSDIMKILEEVENEIRLENLNNEREEFEKVNNLFIEELLHKFEFCPVCDKVINDSVNDICEECCASFNY